MPFTAFASPARSLPSGARRAQGHLVRALGIVFATVVALALLWAAPASAHAQLLETDPEDGAQVDQAPDTIELTFNENIEQIGAEIVITDADGNEVQDGEPEIAGPILAHDLDGERPAGQYTVLWRVVSADGHPVSGEFTFTADAPAGQEAAAATDDEATEDEAPEDDGTGNDAEDAAAQDVEQAGPADDPADPADPVAGGAEGGIPWGLVFALAMVGVLLALVVRARRQLRERQDDVAQQDSEYSAGEPGDPADPGASSDLGDPVEPTQPLEPGGPGDPDNAARPGHDGGSTPPGRGEDDPRG